MSTTAGTSRETDAEGLENGELPFLVMLELAVRDAEVIEELARHAEGDEREEFALSALKIGVLALKQARGRIDADVVRRESDRFLETLEGRLQDHSNVVHARLSGALKEYFDPQDGRFQERVNRLVCRDGELEQVIRRLVGSEDSELHKTLTGHFGQESPLMKLLSPDQTKGLLSVLRQTVDEQLAGQRDHLLKQFSLDNKDGALARFISELTENHGTLSEQLQDKIDSLAQQFSLNDEESALSRLVRNVERAQKTITNEFSLDDDNSALARLKREILVLMSEHRDMHQKFQEEVKIALESMAARKREAERSTRHGLEFEESVSRFLLEECSKAGDVGTPVGNTTGNIKNCKVGDVLIELGPDTAAAGARIVIEAKEQASCHLAAARSEIETARTNRGAEIGIFIFSKRCAPESMEPVTRYGQDVFIVWDAEDPASDIYLRVGLTLARALCVRGRQQSEGRKIDFTELDRAINEVEKRSGSLDEVTTWTETIQRNSEKILTRIRAARKALDTQVELLREKVDHLRENESERTEC